MYLASFSSFKLIKNLQMSRELIGIIKMAKQTIKKWMSFMMNNIVIDQTVSKIQL